MWLPFLGQVLEQVVVLEMAMQLAKVLMLLLVLQVIVLAIYLFQVRICVLNIDAGSMLYHCSVRCTD